MVDCVVEGREVRSHSDSRAQLRDAFRWLGDRTDPDYRADPTGWWRDAELLAALGPALASLVATTPTVVMGPQSRGSLLGPLAALHLGVGFIEVRKGPSRGADSDAWWEVTTVPDYKDRQLQLGVRRDLLRSGEKVLFVDDWAATGAQAKACHSLVEMSGASWVGAAVVVDGLDDPALRRRLNLQCLLRIRDLN